ncbi:MAG: hypothetical protein NTZ97_01160 [Candidatus Moranbacteria bacterium]|nr:hypothetical protein [Candidatus Moranbacteria bacterium]
MAKTKGPLFSQRASGQIGERLVFSQRGSGQQARFQKIQKDVITVKRTTERVKIREAVLAWQNLDDIIKQSWFDLAVGEKLTGYNLFISSYLKSEIVDSDNAIYGFRNYGVFIHGKSV